MGSMSFFLPRAVVEFHSALPGSGSTTNSNSISFDPYNPAAVPVIQPLSFPNEPRYPPAFKMFAQYRLDSSSWTTVDDQTLLRLRARGKNWNEVQREAFPSKTGNACRKRHELLMERGYKSSEPITRDDCGISGRSPTPNDVRVDASRKSSIATPSTQNTPGRSRSNPPSIFRPSTKV